MRQILEGSNAIAKLINLINPGVVSAYPITPQTHIVEDLAKFKADGEGKYEYVRAESEFAAASIVAGASAAGVRTYTATSSQGLLLMAEVVFNIAGMRLPVVMTVANRAVSAPINIWNDQSDAMAVRDAGWIMLFAEDVQETIAQHLLAYKVAEKLQIPVMVNLDGFILTHTLEPVALPDEKTIKKFLPDYKPKTGEYLDPANPVTLGALATPDHYMEIRQDLNDDILASKKIISDEYEKLMNIFSLAETKNQKKDKIPASSAGRRDMRYEIRDTGLTEYYGPKNPDIILVAMGSVIGTMKEAVDEWNADKKSAGHRVGILKIKCFRPFPGKEIGKICEKTKKIAVIDKSISLGHIGPLASDLKAVLQKNPAEIKSFVVGLGGRDITRDMIKKIISDFKKFSADAPNFVG
ncbi:MAG: pyruvate ferredoxin oxidoreductase [Patescibacteria group bacterium]|jgi:pyruvate ferredoxin oxidoreductase alpha subunit